MNAFILEARASPRLDRSPRSDESSRFYRQRASSWTRFKPTPAEIRSALAFAEVRFLEKARDGILKSRTADPAVLTTRAPALDGRLLGRAQAFAESDPDRTIEAYRRALSIHSVVARRVKPTGRLADLIAGNNLG